MLRFILPGMSDYGATEQKIFSRTFMIKGLFFAVLFHFFLLGIYWLDVTFLAKKEAPRTRIVRIMKYEELGPPPSVAENTYGEDLFSDKGTVPAGRGRSGSGSSSSEARRQSRAALSRSVSGKGILGMMTGVGVSMVKDGTGVLGGEGEGLGDNLNELLSSVGNGNSRENPGSEGGSDAGSEAGAGGAGLAFGQTGHHRRRGRQAGRFPLRVHFPQG